MIRHLYSTCRFARGFVLCAFHVHRGGVEDSGHRRGAAAEWRARGRNSAGLETIYFAGDAVDLSAELFSELSEELPRERPFADSRWSEPAT